MKYGTDWLEVVAPDEEARFEALAQDLVAIQKVRDERYAEKARSLHRKGVAGFAAKFTVPDDLASALPPELHVGPFRPGAKHDAYVRLSNGTWDRRSDKAPDIRGFAIKLLGVGGRKVLTGTEEPRTQDFLMIDVPVASASSPDEFVAFARVAAGGSEATLPIRLMWELGPIRGLKFLRHLVTGLRRPFASFAAARFYSASTYRFGPTAARYALTPVKLGPPAEPGPRDFYSQAMSGVVRGGFAWDFQVQLYQDEARTPIERNDVEWRAEDSPFVTIARLEIPPTDPDSAEAKATAAMIETLAFDLWHAVEELRPIGAMNRARKVAYFKSTTSRGAAPEPPAPNP